MMGLTSNLRYRKYNREQAELFDRIMSVAEEVPEQVLVKFIGQLVRPIQSDLILTGMKEGPRSDDHNMSADRFFFRDILRSELRPYRESLEAGSEYSLSLKSDPVLPWPWNRDRLKSAFSEYGPAIGEPWRQDHYNHLVSLWLPWRIGFVECGNHSISAGIVFGEGTVEPSEVMDCTKMLDVIRTDGRHWHLLDEAIESVRDGRTAAIWEIGRRVSNNG